jgi:hypothetical protein
MLGACISKQARLIRESDERDPTDARSACYTCVATDATALTNLGCDMNAIAAQCDRNMGQWGE